MYYRPPEGGEPFDVFSIATLPKYKYKVGLYYWQLPDTGFRASINVQHDSEWATNVADGPFRGSIPARTIWDASIGYKWFNRLSIDVTATNLLNKRYNYPGLPEIGRQVLARAIYTFGN
ncbi:MAG: TonB-dependent receptor [Bacteroidetes bacterium]|nr:MAG: TonB-dependent receptor [Bacteroidota bacterium]